MINDIVAGLACVPVAIVLTFAIPTVMSLGESFVKAFFGRV